MSKNLENACLPRSTGGGGGFRFTDLIISTDDFDMTMFATYWTAVSD